MKTDKRLEVLVVREAEVKKQKRPIGLFCFVGVAGLQPPRANLYVSVSYKT